jgi:hypothetical protein
VDLEYPLPNLIEVTQEQFYCVIDVMYWRRTAYSGGEIYQAAGANTVIGKIIDGKYYLAARYLPSRY